GNKIIRLNLRVVASCATYDTTFRPDEKFERAFLETRDVQFLYSMDETAYFMDLESYEQYELPVDSIEDELLYLLENMEVKIQFYGSEVIGVEVPQTVTLKVKETKPSIKRKTIKRSGKTVTM